MIDLQPMSGLSLVHAEQGLGGATDVGILRVSQASRVWRTEPSVRVLVPSLPPVTASETLPVGRPSPGAAVLPTPTTSGARQLGKLRAAAPGRQRVSGCADSGVRGMTPGFRRGCLVAAPTTSGARQLGKLRDAAPEKLGFQGEELGVQAGLPGAHAHHQQAQGSRGSSAPLRPG